MSSSDDTRWPWESNSDEEGEHGQHGNRQFAGSSPFAYGSEQQQQQQQYAPPQLQLQSNEAFAHEMLTAHNRYRAMHHASPLTLDRDLTRGAQLWAEKMASQDRLVPDVDLNTGTAGENLAMRYNSARTNFSGGEFADNWYGGIVDYDFYNNIPRRRQGSAVLAFTQLVWKDSRHAGFGRAVARSGKVYAVGRYYPAGNTVGEFRQNVSPPVSVLDSRQTGPSPSNTFDSRQIGPTQRSMHDRRHTDPSPTMSDRRQSGPSAAKMFDNRQSMPTQPTHTSVSESTPTGPTSTFGKSGMHETSSRLSETFGPEIGAMRPTDTLVSSNKTTKYENGSTVVTIEEKYTADDGSSYTRQRKMTYFGEHRKY